MGLQDLDGFLAGGHLLPQCPDLLLLPFDFRRSYQRTDTLHDVGTHLRRRTFQLFGFQFPFYRLQFLLGRFQLCGFVFTHGLRLLVTRPGLLFLLLQPFYGLPLLFFDTEQCVDVVLQILLPGYGVAVKLLRGNMTGDRSVDTAL